MVSDAAHARLRAALLVASAAPAGVLLRILLSRRFGYDGGASPNGAVPLSLGANVLGSAFLGLLDSAGSPISASLRTGLGTGFCASLTTFAAAIFHSGRLLIGGAVGRGATSLLLTILVPPAAYVVACDVASLFVKNDIEERQWGMKQWISTGICFAVFGIVFSALVVAALVTRRMRWRAALLSPFGALARYSLSVILNSNAGLPYGTLIANLVACVIDSLLAVLIYKRIRVDGWLFAARIGFAGSLSTVSAFAAELVRLRKGRRLFYGAISATVGLLIVIVIFGSVIWSS